MVFLWILNLTLDVSHRILLISLISCHEKQRIPLIPSLDFLPLLLKSRSLVFQGLLSLLYVLKNNTMLVGCFSKQQPSNLEETFFNKPVKIDPHKSLEYLQRSCPVQGIILSITGVSNILECVVHVHNTDSFIMSICVSETLLTLSSIDTHFNTLKKKALGKHCGKR